MSIKITLMDRVNCHVGGLDVDVISQMVKRFSYMKKGAHMEASYRMKMWDGKVSLIEPDGDGFFTYVFLLEDILKELEDFDINFDTVEIIDENQPSPLPENIEPIDEDFLLKETGFKLRDHQVTGANACLENRYGLIDGATSYGKTLLCLALSKRLDPYIKTLVVAPTEYLVNQTKSDYLKSDLDFVVIDAKIPPKKRAELIDKHRHIITTTKLFYNMSEHLSKHQFAVLIDEAHEFGDVMEEKMRMDYAFFPFRIGMSGSLPNPKKDKLKYMKLCCFIGGSIFKSASIKQRELMDKNFASKVKIFMVKTVDKTMFEFSVDNPHAYDYSVEEDYFCTNRARVAALTEYLKSLPPKNTLILARAELASNLNKSTGYPLIVQDTPLDERTEYLNKFDTNTDAVVIGTFRTASTGISKNNIMRVICIDMGDSESYALQAIGRGMRLDGSVNEFEMIDIYCELRYGIKHAKNRLKLYKAQKHPVVANHDTIEIKQESD